MTAQVTTFTDGQALSTLLGLEGFLLAVIGLAISLAAPNQPRPRTFGRAKPIDLARGAALIMVVVAVGGLAAWIAIFTGGRYEGLGRAIMAGSILIAVVAQPGLALLLAFGAKTR